MAVQCETCGTPRPTAPQRQRPAPVVATPPPPPQSPGWGCAVCTFINSPSTDVCDACAAHRPPLVRPSPDPAPAGSWVCSCTTVNPARLNACSVCGTVRRLLPAPPPLEGASIALLGDVLLDNVRAVAGGRCVLDHVVSCVAGMRDATVRNYAVEEFAVEQCLNGGHARGSRRAREQRGDPLPSHTNLEAEGADTFFRPLNSLAELANHSRPDRPFIAVLSVGTEELRPLAGFAAALLPDALAQVSATVGRLLHALRELKPRAPRVVLLLPPLPPPDDAALAAQLATLPPPRDWEEEAAPPPAATFAGLLEEAFAPVLLRGADLGGIVCVDLPCSLPADDAILWARPGVPSDVGGERIARLIATACERLAREEQEGAVPPPGYLLRLRGGGGGGAGGFEFTPLRAAPPQRVMPWHIFPRRSFGARMWGHAPPLASDAFRAMIPLEDDVSFDIVVPRRGGRGALRLGSIGAAREAVRTNAVALVVQCAKEFSGEKFAVGVGATGGGGGSAQLTAEQLRAARLARLEGGGAGAAPPPPAAARVLDVGHDDIDLPNQDVDSLWSRALPEIERVRAAGGDVLVNCRAGMSRSAALAVAHLMEGTEGLPLRDALLAVSSARRIAFVPNLSFVCKLRAREQRRAGACSVPKEELLAIPNLKPPACANEREARDQLNLMHSATWRAIDTAPLELRRGAPLPLLSLVQAASGARGPLLLGGACGDGAAAAAEAERHGAATLLLLERRLGGGGGGGGGGARMSGSIVGVAVHRLAVPFPLAGDALQEAAATVASLRGAGGVAVSCAEEGLEADAAAAVLAHLAAPARGRAQLPLLAAWRLLAQCGWGMSPSMQAVVCLMGAHNREELRVNDRVVGHPLFVAAVQLVQAQPWFVGIPPDVAKAMLFKWVQEIGK